MSDLVPEEAIERAARASFSRVGSTGRFDDLPSAHRDGWLASARSGLEAAAPLILATELSRMADDYAAAGDVFGKRAESLLSERPEGYQAMADRCVGKAVVLDQEAVALRRRASVLRGEGDRDGA